MKTFGLNIIKKNVNFDVKNVAARLFLCANISAEQASTMLNSIVTGKIKVENFITTTDKYIPKEISESYRDIMSKKIEAWKSTIGDIKEKDFMYLKKTFGIDLLEEKPTTTTSSSSSSSLMTPKEMASYVKMYVKGQDEAIEKLSVSFFLHLDSKKRGCPNKLKSPVLLAGPTGVGKSEIYRRFAEICNCPVIRINTTEVVPSSWKGLHINDLLAREINKTTTIEELRYAVIVFHEFDKVTHYGQRKVGDNDIDIDMMRDIMRLFETDHDLILDQGYDQQTLTPKTERLPIDNLLIVFDGAFNGIENVIKKRINVANVGFKSAHDVKDCDYIMKHLTNDDLREWGIMPELLGRLGETIILNPLSEEAIYDIMKSAKDNILEAHIEFCSNNNTELVFTDNAIHCIANEAYKSGLGFRNVKTLIYRVLNEVYYSFQFNSKAKMKKRIEITEDQVKIALNNK